MPVGAVLAALIRKIPQGIALLKAIKPASKADALLKRFPGIERRFGRSRAMRILRFLIKVGKRVGFGPSGGLIAPLPPALEREAKMIKQSLKVVKKGPSVGITGGQRRVVRHRVIKT